MKKERKKERKKEIKKDVRKRKREGRVREIRKRERGKE